jgi:anti-anti-sigma regulatory factor
MVDLSALRFYTREAPAVQMTALSPVSAECPIFVGIFEEFTWIRCEGKGSFMNSPAIKEFGMGRIAAGEKRIVFDLGACTGMDSTFMGTLAGLAGRLPTQAESGIQVADAGDRNRRSLEDLGLDFLMEIDPPEAKWLQTVNSIRTNLTRLDSLPTPTQFQQTRHVLDAHQILSKTNEKNTRAFANVVTLLESELAEKPESPNK